RSMAENIGWILDHETPGSKMVIWAHNGHVEKTPDSGSMGSHLFNSFGRQMTVFGFAFNQGSFQALDLEPGKGRHPFTVGPAPPGSIDATLAAAANSLAALDLRALPSTGPVTEWFQRSHLSRDIGAVFTDQNTSRFIDLQTITKKYDALLFVEH